MEFAGADRHLMPSEELALALLLDSPSLSFAALSTAAFVTRSLDFCSPGEIQTPGFLSIWQAPVFSSLAVTFAGIQFWCVVE